MSAFAQCEKVIVSLANNHMYDYPDEIEYTKSLLEENNIGYFGLLENGRIIPYEYENSDGIKYAFFGHCWRLYTRTNRNTVNEVRVVDCDYPLFVEAVSEYIKVHSDVEVYCFMHWNYDLEILPFPMHRKIARELVDVGVKGVIGNHSHVSQGMEVYKGRPIAYCLGNFYFPSGYYFEGKLNFPSESKITYGVRINKNEYHTIC